MNAKKIPLSLNAGICGNAHFACTNFSKTFSKKALLAFAALTVTAATGFADTYTWSGSADANWGSENWNDGTTSGVSWANGNDAVFSGSTGYTLTVDADYAPSNITVSGSGNWVFANGGTYTLGNAGTLTMNGTGVLQLQYGNVYTGAVALNSGTIQLNNGGNNQNREWTNNFTINGGRLVSYEKGNSTVSGTIAIGANGASFGTTYESHKSLILSGEISGDGAITIRREGSDGAVYSGGRVILTGANADYTGEITIDGARAYSFLQVGNGGTTGSLGGATTVTVNNDSKNSNSVIFKRSDTYTVTGGGSTTLDGKNTNATITGSGRVTQEGSGTLVMAGTHTYIGGTTISSGTLEARGSSSLGDGTVTVASGATLALQSGGTWTNNIVLNGGTLKNLNGVANITGTVDVGTTGGTIAISYQISNGLYLKGNVTGSGTIKIRDLGGYDGAKVVFEANNDYTGETNIDSNSNASILQIGNGGTTGTLGDGTGAVVVGGKGQLHFNRGDTYEVTNAISGNGTIRQFGAGTVILSADNSISGLVTTGVTTGDYDGPDPSGLHTTITGVGTLQVGNGGTTGTLGTATVQNEGALQFNRSDAYEVANTITGSGTVKILGGEITFTGDKTYTGATTVDGGKLVVDGSITSAVAVNTGGTLGGIGTITGDVTIADGGTLAPGNSPGTLHIDGNVTLADGATLVIAVEGSGAGEYSTLNITGEMLIESGAKLHFDVADGALFLGNTLDLLGGTISSLGGFDNFEVSASSGYELTYLSDGTFQVRQIPEPSTYALGAAGLLGALALLRRRRKN